MFYILMFIPVLLASLGTIYTNLHFLILSIFIMFFVVAILPNSKKHANLYMFALVSITSIPVNIQIIIQIDTLDFWIDEWLVLSIIRSFVFYMMLLSIEQLVFGFITRKIWKQQEKMIIDKNRLKQNKQQ